MFKGLELPIIKLPDHLEQLREEVRQFIAEETKSGKITPRCDAMTTGFDPEFSRKLGQRGWLGMTLPKKYGGHERTALERFVVAEELLAAGAPIGAHWAADRQTGPLILRYGTEEQKQKFLPRIARGELCFSIGLSEPNSGCDLAALSCKAPKVEGGWLLNGSKLWTSLAHHSQYMITLCRTSTRTEKKHEGMSQLLVDMSAPGVTVRPIYSMSGGHHFNEVIFEDVFIPDDMLIGQEGNGWNQALAELAFERSGPDRFLNTFPLFVALIRVLQLEGANERAHIAIAELAASLWTIRKMSLGVAGLLQQGVVPSITAPLVKDLGTQFEVKVIEVARSLVDSTPSLTSSSMFSKLLAEALLYSPGFTIRGGATEILRGIIARGIGVR